MQLQSHHSFFCISNRWAQLGDGKRKRSSLTLNVFFYIDIRIIPPPMCLVIPFPFCNPQPVLLVCAGYFVCRVLIALLTSPSLGVSRVKAQEGKGPAANGHPGGAHPSKL